MKAFRPATLVLNTKCSNHITSANLNCKFDASILVIITTSKDRVCDTTLIPPRRSASPSLLNASKGCNHIVVARLILGTGGRDGWSTIKDAGSSTTGGGNTTSGGNGKDGQLSCPKCGNPCSQVETFVCKFFTVSILL